MADAQSPQPLTFGAFLRHAMNSAGLPTAPRLGAVAGLDSSVINRWMRGKTIPTIDNLRQIAPHIRVPLRELMVVAGHMTRDEAGLDGEPTPPGPPPSVYDDIRDDPYLSDDKKQALITVIKAIREEYAEDTPSQRSKQA